MTAERCLITTPTSMQWEDQKKRVHGTDYSNVKAYSIWKNFQYALLSAIFGASLSFSIPYDHVVYELGAKTRHSLEVRNQSDKSKARYSVSLHPCDESTESTSAFPTSSPDNLQLHTLPFLHLRYLPIQTTMAHVMNPGSRMRPRVA
ncbi:hypothetical protein EDB81DRAFT_861459 [Dactylonectria macrodidyma]|uniref:Uncharacterized protein n=1 Tax=Dactylonectria macrodidyma TaxID=307937 RepID=A0A9P9DLL9_9HYPO|nr:hypothetical protein EDB81DRAFT_861459 [Dactylonectria macrodidyma]